MSETTPDIIDDVRRLMAKLRANELGAMERALKAEADRDRLAAEVERQRAALAFYMNAWERERGGEIGPAQELLDDKGEKARAALHPGHKEPSNESA